MMKNWLEFIFLVCFQDVAVVSRHCSDSRGTRRAPSNPSSSLRRTTSASTTYQFRAGPLYQDFTGSNNPWDGKTVGSAAAPFCADWDDDGDVDCFVGTHAGTIKYYQNTGPGACCMVLTEQTGSNNTLAGVDVGDAAIPFCADFDADNDLDCIIGTLAGNISYYINSGNNGSAVFTLATGSGNPFENVKVGNNAAPFCADFDADNDLDCWVGARDGKVYYFLNSGNSTSANFTQIINHPMSADYGTVVGYASPWCADFDVDGKVDCQIGNFLGNVDYYANVGTATSPSFAKRSGTNNPFSGVAVDTLARPWCGDYDNDNDIDCFYGNWWGRVTNMENTGTVSKARLIERSGATNPLNKVNTGTAAGAEISPFCADFDGDGDKDCILAYNEGFVHYYERVSSNDPSVANFTRRTGAANPFDAMTGSSRIAPFCMDFDGDGDIDCVFGESSGPMEYYQNAGTAQNPSFEEKSGGDDPFNGLNPGSRSKPFCTGKGTGIVCYVGNGDGEIKKLLNTGTASDPAFALETGADNPFNGVDVGHNAAPFCIDFDNDEDVDCAIAHSDGTLKYYRNDKEPGAQDSFEEQTGTNNIFDGFDVGEEVSASSVSAPTHHPQCLPSSLGRTLLRRL